MIRTFADRETERFYATGKSRRLPPDIHRRAAMRLTQLNAATRIQDLRFPHPIDLKRSNMIAAAVEHPHQ